MSHAHVLVKVYAHIWPIHEEALQTWSALLPESPTLSKEEMLCQESDMLKLSYEGIYFPLEDFLATLTPYLHEKSQGKIDYIDLDAWVLTRHTIAGTTIHIRSASLNSVLDYSGH